MNSNQDGKFDSDAPPLTKDELESAKKDNMIRSYPKVIRYKNDPRIPGQEISTASFMLLKEPKDGVVGFIKPRGSFDSEQATKHSEDIISNVDSIFVIHQLNTGYWNPITNNEKYTLDQMDVKTQKEDIALRDRAAKENAAKNAQLQREIQEQKELLRQENPDETEDPDSLDYYTKKRVSQKELRGYIMQATEKLHTLKKSLKKVETEIIQLNKKNPTYIDKWLDNYNNARRRVGLEPLTESDLASTKIVGPIDV